MTTLLDSLPLGSHKSSRAFKRNKSLQAQQPQKYYNIMIWAACATALFGFLRSSKFTLPSQSQFDPNLHFTLSDITLESRHSPQIIQVNIKQSKTNPFRQRIKLSLGCTGHKIYSVKAIVPLLAARGKGPGPCSTTNKC